jgi:hypothetical protein
MSFMSARRGSQTIVAERARAPLHAALEPADHETLGKCVRGFAAERGLVGNDLDLVACRLNDLRPVTDQPPDLGHRRLWAEIGVVHDGPARIKLPLPGSWSGINDPAGYEIGRKCACL